MKTNIVILAAVLLSAGVRAEILFYDNFNGATIKSDWSIENENAALYALTEDALDLTASSGDLYQTANSQKNLFYITNPTAGDFEMTVKLNSFVPASNYTQFNLLAYDDQDNHLRVNYAYINEPSLEIGNETAAVWSSYSSAQDLGTGEFYLRLVKSGSSYSQYYSLNGTDFVQANSAMSYGDGTPAKLAFAALVDPSESSHAYVDWVVVTDSAGYGDTNIDAIPEPAVATLIGLVGVGALVGRRIFSM